MKPYEFITLLLCASLAAACSQRDVKSARVGATAPQADATLELQRQRNRQPAQKLSENKTKFVNGVACTGPNDDIHYGTCGYPPETTNYTLPYSDLTISSTDPAHAIVVTVIACAGSVEEIVKSL